ncbi:MAG: hypothetical protein JSR59_19755 [Proteobacteria bacterium]|nr:hypothetical protein [Pseudomonadota bacterium]
MRVHPWPQLETAPGARPAVWWEHSDAHGLLIDTPAVPLRFAAELPMETAAPFAVSMNELEVAQRRIRMLEGLLVQADLPMTA